MFDELLLGNVGLQPGISLPRGDRRYGEPSKWCWNLSFYENNAMRRLL